MSLDKNVIKLINEISNLGYKVYIVGGAVRDIISNKEIHDYDIASDIPFEKLENLYGAKILSPNANRETAVFKINGLEIEISKLKGKTIEEDLSKRDFTINAVAITNDMEFIDPYEGIKDIKNKTLKLVDLSGKGIEKDPLRILRAIRLSATKGFEIDENTKKIMYQYKDRLEEVAKERILNEFKQILITDQPGKIIKEYKEIFFIIVPELKDTVDFNQYNSYHIYDIFNHILKVVDETDKDVNLRMAALFHDIGKPKKFFRDENGIGHFYGHPNESSQIFNRFANKYKMSNEDKKRINKLILNHEKIMSTKSSKIKQFLQSFGPDEYEVELLFKLKRADILAQNPIYNYRLEENDKLKSLYFNTIKMSPAISVKDLQISGKDLIELGYEGKEIGNLLNEILTKVINEEINNDKNSILEYINNTKKLHLK